MRIFLKRSLRALARDEGVAGIVIAMVISIAAFSSLAVFLSKHSGPSRALPRVEQTNARADLLKSAVLTYVIQNSTLPCPDTTATPDGLSDTCNPTGTTSGVLPWRTLGIGRVDALDGYGTFYRYVVSAEAKDLCESVGSDYDGTAAAQFTGEVITSDELEVRTTAQAAGEGAYIPFAIISHGENALGGISASGTALPTPFAGSSEATNATAAPTSIFTGPYNTGADAAYFDDVVITASVPALKDICEDLTPAAQANTDLYDPFSGAINPDMLEASAVDAPTYTTDADGNGVAQLTTTDSYLVSAAEYRLATNERPVYISADWTPDPLSTGASDAGFSIITRADGTPTGDLDNPGITFRFGGGAFGAGASLSILNDGVALTTTPLAPTFNLIAAETYKLEVYDGGNTVWMRVTQKNSPTNTAYASATTGVVDLTGNQRVVFVNGANTTSYIDEVTVGFPMMALDTLGAGYAYTSTNDNGTDTGVLTLETWVKPRAFPATGQTATLVSSWMASNLANSAFRLFIDEDGDMSLSLGRGVVTIDTRELGVRLTADTWSHLAVTYNAGALVVYKDGARVSSFTGVLTGAGIRTDNNARFAVGAHWTGSGTTFTSIFNGSFSDVRVWNDVRTAAEIQEWHDRRLPLVNTATELTNLVMNWRLDISSTGVAPTNAPLGPDMAGSLDSAGTIGPTTTSAVYGTERSVYFRTLSTEICGPGLFSVNGNRQGPYRCDFRESTTGTTSYTIQGVDIGGVTTMHAKAWGGGGGVDTTAPPNNGGGGGFGSGMFVNTGVNLAIRIGTGGTGAATGGAGLLTQLTRSGLTIRGNAGAAGTNTLDGNAGTGLATGAINPVTAHAAAAANRRPGCVPTIAVVGDPCADPHYAATGAPVAEPGYGGDASGADGLNGQRGALILLW